MRSLWLRRDSPAVGSKWPAGRKAEAGGAGRTERSMGTSWTAHSTSRARLPYTACWNQASYAGDPKQSFHDTADGATQGQTTVHVLSKACLILATVAPRPACDPSSCCTSQPGRASLPDSKFMSVVLPAPFGPTMQILLPMSIPTLTFCNPKSSRPAAGTQHNSSARSTIRLLSYESCAVSHSVQPIAPSHLTAR